MDLSELDCHVPQIRHLLPLEPVQVGLQGGRSVLEILGGRLQRVLQLRKDKDILSVFALHRPKT